MTAAAHRQREAAVARVAHRAGDVGPARRAHHDARASCRSSRSTGASPRRSPRHRAAARASTARTAARRRNASGCSTGGSSRGVLDHVQRPAVAGARRLGDPQRRREIVPPPDQGRGDGDPREVRRRDRGHAELARSGAQRGLRARRAGAVEVVAANGSQRSPICSRRPSRSNAQRRQKRVVRVAGSGRATKRDQREPRSAAPGGTAQPERVHEHERLSRSLWSAAKPAAMAPPSTCADQHRRRRACALDQLAEPREHAIAVQRRRAPPSAP